MTGKGQRQGKDTEKNRDRTRSVKGEVRTGTGQEVRKEK